MVNPLYVDARRKPVDIQTAGADLFSQKERR
jgi:hypothetical protein